MKPLVGKLRGLEHLDKRSRAEKPGLAAFDRMLKGLEKEGDRFLVINPHVHRKSMELRLNEFRNENRSSMHVASVTTTSGWMIFVVWSLGHRPDKIMCAETGRVIETREVRGLVDLDLPL